MGDAHDIAEIACRLARLAARQLVDFDLGVLGQEFADDHGLAQELGGDAVAQCGRKRAGGHYHPLGAVGGRFGAGCVGRTRSGGMQRLLDVDEAEPGFVVRALDAQQDGVAQPPEPLGRALRPRAGGHLRGTGGSNAIHRP